jgi:hypothetical protein
MEDYCTLEQLALKLGSLIEKSQNLSHTACCDQNWRGGRRFFSSREAHHLQPALRLAREHRIRLEKTFAKVEDLQLRQVGTAGD